MRTRRLLFWACCTALLDPARLAAQPVPRDRPPLPGPGRPMMDMIGVQEAFEKIVKGAPYQAQTVTEITQVLADGNRIVQKIEGVVYRDGEGRMRRENAVATLGRLMAGEPPRVVMIHDPVARAHYQLDPESHIAHRLPPRPPGWRQPRPGDEDGSPPGAGSRPPRPEGAPLPVSESLGKKTIEGIETDGTRDVIAIPAGEIGNEKPIQIVNERWYSAELQIVVSSSRSDPRLGMTTFRLTNVKRVEPDRSLFTVPEGYQITDDPPHMPGPPPRGRE